VLGPTGVGKTDISLEIAQHYGCHCFFGFASVLPRTEDWYGSSDRSPTERGKALFYGTHSIHDEYNCGQYELDVMICLVICFWSMMW
jgi:tRNA dimethylallyltransferase